MGLLDGISSFRRSSLKPTTTVEGTLGDMTTMISNRYAGAGVGVTATTSQRPKTLPVSAPRSEEWGRFQLARHGVELEGVTANEKLNDNMVPAEAVPVTGRPVPETTTTCTPAYSRVAEKTSVQAHGALGSPQWATPIVVTEFDVNARLSFTDSKAHEYIDQPEVLAAKVALLARMIHEANQPITYTGAGISTAAGIDDYATKAKTTSVTMPGRPKVRDWKDASPTYSHRVLTAMYEAGLLKHWIQQNHDSLPQKAGFPQHSINEIHGSLHDPANPVVPYEGTLRGDLFAWMHQWQARADLCLALGTSMSGFNCDSVPTSVAKRFHETGRGHGLVIVNLQETQYDALSSLRIWGRIDDVMTMLATELGIEGSVRPMTSLYTPQVRPGTQIDDDVYRVPFDAVNGASCSDDSQGMVWDLRVGQRVRLTGGPYAGDEGTIMSKNESGHYRIRFEDSINKTFNAKRRPFSLWLGSWWIEMATKGLGNVPDDGRLPFVNVNPSTVATAATH